MRGIKFVSDSGNTGYGRAGRAYLRALRGCGVPVTWMPMVIGNKWRMWLEPYEGAELEGDEFSDLVNRSLDYDTVIVHLIPEYFMRWRSIERNKRVIGMTVWELDVVPKIWVEWLNQLDGVIVPCQWNRKLFLEAGVNVPIHVVPHLVEPVLATQQQLPGIAEDDYVFYTIAAWRERNAPHLTLMSFLSEFGAQDRAVLVIKTACINERWHAKGFWDFQVKRWFEDTRRDYNRFRKQSQSTARVLLVTEDWTAEQINALHQRGDCYVSMTRTEGWGLGAYEAAQAGNPVVITGHGGQLDFLPASLAYHVDYQLVPFTEGTWGELGANWAEPDLAMGGKLMRSVFENPEDARRRGRMLKSYVEEHFRTDLIVQELLSFLRSIR